MTTLPTKLIPITESNAGYKNFDYDYFMMFAGQRYRLLKEDRGYVFKMDGIENFPGYKWWDTKINAINSVVGNPEVKLYAWPIEISKPKSNVAEVLYTLITTGSVSILDYPWLSGFRTRCSEIRLKYGIILSRKTMTGVNKFDREFKYTVHILPYEHKEKAIEIYNKINK